MKILSTVGNLLLLFPVTAPAFWGLVLWNTFVHQELLIRRLSMNDYELTVYGSIVFWLFFLETALSIPGIVSGVVEPEQRRKILLLGTASIHALPFSVLLTLLAWH
ncbi:MAG: hypothetical protein F6K00_15945 [Leptolyngbya sp. SIOISBB]|nr:hypothetical protein [Leptolyngbya sp. SIOISBB]